MNLGVLNRWVAALRSGDYVQGREHLRYYDEDERVFHCCLGVLCELAVADGVLERGEPVKFWRARVQGYGVPEFDASETSVLPPEVVAWAGLVNTSPTVSHPTFGRVELTVLNDGQMDDDDDAAVPVEPTSFAIIADLLESGDPL